MNLFFSRIFEYIMNFLSRYSYFFNWGFYEYLFSKYFSVAGFIVGFIFVLLIYFSDPEEDGIPGFLKVLTSVAVINSCSAITQYVASIINPDGGVAEISFWGNAFNAPDNLISGLILTLIVYSCYKRYGGRAFLFGLSVYSALVMLNFEYLDGMDIVSLVFVFSKILLAGLLCMIICNRKYFFTGWIWWFCFYLLIKISVFTISSISGIGFEANSFFNGLLQYLFTYGAQFIVFAVILTIAIIFEKNVLKR